MPKIICWNNDAVQGKNIPYQPIIGIHTKACAEALGVEDGLAAIAEAGFSHVVVWAGEDGEHITALKRCKRFGLSVLSLALPKVPGLIGCPSTPLEEWIARAREFGAPAVTLIFGDTIAQNPSERDWLALGRWVQEVKIPLLLENNGRPYERFSDPCEIVRLLECVPSLRVVLDLGHLAASGRITADVAKLSRRTGWIEVHDNNGRDDLHLPLGQGSGVFEIGLQRRHTPPDTVVIETDARLGADRRAWVEALHADATYLQACLARLPGA